MRVFNGIDALTAAAGGEIGISDWVVVDQDRINSFADVTGDHQWIHVDVARAADGVFGGPIAHGFLSLSLLPSFLQQIFRVDGVQMAINYGLDRVRFPAPVPAGARLRGAARLVEVTPLAGAVQARVSTSIDIEGSYKPACVVESLIRYVQ